MFDLLKTPLEYINSKGIFNRHSKIFNEYVLDVLK